MIHKNSETHISRRSFLGRLTALAAAVPALWFLFKFLSPEGIAGEELLSASEDEIPEGGALVYAEKKAALLKKDGRITAFSLVCTHLGCTISLDGDKFACPCHGSVFSLDGSVIKGPAVRRLDEYETHAENGKITVLSRVKS
jgi:Rieske Fe-S protein